jgi:NAD(P)-dependent dehydrogenase (short-subunit alcohol dehydrogenase family)
MHNLATLARPAQSLSGTRLQNRVAIVTGAGSAGDLPGTGSAMAILFAAQGAPVAIVDIDRERATHTLQLVEQAGGRGIVIPADITSAAACEDVVAKTLAAFGTVHILVNNAALSRPGDILHTTEADIDATIALNLKAPMLLSQFSAKAMRANGGSILNISSVGGHRGFGLPSYASTKAALSGLTRDLAFTLGEFGIRVNCIVPGVIHTPMGGRTEAAREQVRKATLLRTEGTAWDIAFAALFLASDEARWITGIDLFVDAGMFISGRAPALDPAAVAPRQTVAAG